MKEQKEVRDRARIDSYLPAITRAFQKEIDGPVRVKVDHKVGFSKLEVWSVVHGQVKQAIIPHTFDGPGVFRECQKTLQRFFQ